MPRLLVGATGGISLIRPVNEPSRRVAERVGMRAGERVHFHGFEHIMDVVHAP
jgi:hypothetical protein